MRLEGIFKSQKYTSIFFRRTMSENQTQAISQKHVSLKRRLFIYSTNKLIHLLKGFDNRGSFKDADMRQSQITAVNMFQLCLETK